MRIAIRTNSRQLSSLTGRLDTGILPSIREEMEKQQYSKMPSRISPAMEELDTTKEGPAEIKEIRELLETEPDTLQRLLLLSDPIYEEFEKLPPEQAWAKVARLAEACWQTISAPTTISSKVERDQLRPLAARLRFLTLSEPFRDDTQIKRSQLFDVYSLPFGNKNTLITLVHQARRDWLDFLNCYQSHPLLVLAPPSELEQEIDAVVFADPKKRYPFVLSSDALARVSDNKINSTYRSNLPETEQSEESSASSREHDRQRAKPTVEDVAVTFDALGRHILPRMRLFTAAKLAIRVPIPGGKNISTSYRCTAACVALLMLFIAAILALTGLLPFAALLAGASYIFLVFCVAAFGSIWASLWTLRLPATSAFGLLVLVALHPDWWLSPDHVWRPLSVLVGASVGYLIVEARNHGVAAGWAVARALAVAAVGTLHALLISTIGLVAVLPSYSEDGDRLTEAIGSHPTAVLALATAWCLTVGVFSQVLWDDRPITARLAHMTWRSGGIR